MRFYLSHTFFDSLEKGGCLLNALLKEQEEKGWYQKKYNIQKIHPGRIIIIQAEQEKTELYKTFFCLFGNDLLHLHPCLLHEWKSVLFLFCIITTCPGALKMEEKLSSFSSPIFLVM